MPRDLQFRIEDGQALREMIRDLRELEDGRELAKRLRRGLRQAAKPMVPAVRRSVLALPSRGLNARRGRDSLRRSVAKATQIRAKTSGSRPYVAVWVNPKRMPEGQANLPAYLEGIRPFQRWRHPVYGDGDTWVTQPPKPYFYRAIRPLEDGVAEEGRRVMNEIAAEIAGR
jgi:hypothetical protein